MNSPDDSSILISALSLVVAIFSLVAACYAVCETNFTRESRENLDQAIKCLEWAYAALMGSETRGRAPEAFRNGWLTAARHILRYYELRGSIHCETHKLARRIHHEQWRREFYVALGKIGTNPKYFKCNSAQPAEWIYEKSALIVHYFANDSELLPDPLDSPAANAMAKKEGIASPALEGHIEAFKEYLQSQR
ncbi:MAG: hypothetical protein U0790_00060 [Isosphaeraceae bacterium]